MVAQTTASRPPLLLNDPRALSALGALPAEFDRASAGDAWATAGLDESAQDQLWEAFCAAGLFAKASDNGASWWDELGWREARAYHQATRDYPFVQMDQRDSFARDGGRMDSYRDASPPPPVYQSLGGRESVQLDRLGPGESPDERLRLMPAEERLALGGVDLLLDVCFGERGQMTVAGGGSCLLKSIPSGGARHPTEVFLAAFDLRGVEPGIYHYDVEHHRLDLVREGQQRDQLRHATFDLFTRHEAAPAAVLAFTSVVERPMWRYRDPRSFRAILVDVGHAVMAYRRVARMLGFRTFAYQKMRDAEVAELLCVDRVAQPPLYVGTLVP